MRNERVETPHCFFMIHFESNFDFFEKKRGLKLPDIRFTLYLIYSEATYPQSCCLYIGLQSQYTRSVF